MACWIIQYASAGVEHETMRSPAMWAKHASGLSLWCSTAPMPPPKGTRTTTGSAIEPRDRFAHLGELGDDLVVGGVDEPVELDLADRSVAAQREADGGADDAALGERRVDDSVLAEVLLQAVRDAEDAAELADVLAHDEDLRVVLHGGAQAPVDRLGDGGLAHRAPPSVDACAPPGSAKLAS